MLLSTIRLANPYKDYTEFDVLPVLKHREDVKYKLFEYLLVSRPLLQG
jgi:hypothetical protein